MERLKQEKIMKEYLESLSPITRFIYEKIYLKLCSCRSEKNKYKIKIR
jgi:hypothetical protein